MVNSNSNIYKGYNQAKPVGYDKEISHTNFGTPGGEYLRRYWHPVALTSEVSTTPLQIKILGEDLVIFKTTKNKIGLVTAVNPDERYGILKIDRNYIVNDFSEKPKNSTHWINGGFFVFNKKMFNYLDKNKNEMLEREPLKKLTKHKQLVAYQHKGFWKPMDTLRDKIELDKIWKSKKAKWKS